MSMWKTPVAKLIYLNLPPYLFYLVAYFVNGYWDWHWDERITPITWFLISFLIVFGRSLLRHTPVAQLIYSAVAIACWVEVVSDYPYYKAPWVWKDEHWQRMRWGFIFAVCMVWRRPLLRNLKSILSFLNKSAE